MCTLSIRMCTPCLGYGVHLPSLQADSRLPFQIRGHSGILRLPSCQRRALGPSVEGVVYDTRRMRMETWLGAAGCGDPGALGRNSLPEQPRRKADRALHREGRVKAF